MHNAVLSTFPNTSIMCCRFHLSQNVWKKIQSLGLIGKWLSKFFGLPFLSHVEVENSFVEDTMFDAPNDDKCSKFADYVSELHYGHVQFSTMHMGINSGSKLFKDKQWTRKLSWAFQCTVLCKTSQHFIFLDVLKQIRVSLMHSHVCSCRELISQRGNVSESAGCSR
jgi:hypothetical protein